MTKRDELQQKLIEVRDFIYDSVEDRGCPPTVREICDRFNIKSTSSAVYYLNKLEEMGEIKLTKFKSRGIAVGTKPLSRNMANIPLLGSITAGVPKLAYEECEDTYTFSHNIFNYGDSDDVFMLTVIGTSMIDIGINDGDKILVKKQSVARNGQVVAALIDGESATVKRYYNENGVVRLHPENQYMPDIYPEDVAILGVVIGLIRTDIK